MWEKGGKLFRKGNKRAAGIRVRKDSATMSGRPRLGRIMYLMGDELFTEAVLGFLKNTRV